MNTFKYFLLLAGLSLISSCDKIDDPVIKLENQYLEGVYGPAPTFTLLENPQRNVLFEEFTGHVCGFCPPATAQLKEWDEQYGDRIVAIAIHAGTLAEPGAEPFQTDYRTAIGDIFWGQVNGGYNPSARMDRDLGPSEVYGFPQWPSELQARLNTPTDVAMQMKTSYDETNKNVNIHVHSQFLRNISGAVNLVVLISESKIISAQEDYNLTPPEILDYEHNHVLRAGITGAAGLPLITDPKENDQLVKSFTYNLNDAWVPANCHIAAFLIDNTTGKVLNAVEGGVTE